VSIKRDSAAMYGLTAATIGSAVRAELSGITATTMTMDGDDIEVVIKGNDTASASIDALRSMPVAAGTGGYVPLSTVADVSVELAPQTVTRYNQSRQVSITGDLEGIDVTTMTLQIQEVIANYDMPEGYTAEAGGTYEDMSDSFHDLILALIVALGLVYFVLASQFESFILPVIVMMILPVSLSGALFGLPLTGSDLSIIAVIGLIMLSGVVVNASIILVDYIKVRRLMGESKEEAILEACPLRIRPIMMTTLTTILAMVPMAFGYGDGGELMQPMAIVMITGMIISTFVTLLFTPVYYSLLDSLNVRLANFFFRKRRAADQDELTPAP
jgi:HAE1 family hydrophobic/amphiphilic exporter-1